MKDDELSALNRYTSSFLGQPSRQRIAEFEYKAANRTPLARIQVQIDTKDNIDGSKPCLPDLYNAGDLKAYNLPAPFVQINSPTDSWTIDNALG